MPKAWQPSAGHAVQGKGTSQGMPGGSKGCNRRCDSWHAGCRCSQSLQPALQLRARLLLLPCSLGQQDSCRHDHGLGVAYQRRQARPRHLRLLCSSAHALLPASHLSQEHTDTHVHAAKALSGRWHSLHACRLCQSPRCMQPTQKARPPDLPLRRPAYAANEQVCVADFENQIGSRAFQAVSP